MIAELNCEWKMENVELDRRIKSKNIQKLIFFLGFSFFLKAALWPKKQRGIA
jgi:hypothetical protein